MRVQVSSVRILTGTVLSKGDVANALCLEGW